MAKYRDDPPLGQMMAVVYWSWSFTQKDTIQEFKTDDGLPYWYPRVTGQTFWERPLYEDELDHLLKGGTKLDMSHDEALFTMIKGIEGSEPRLHQGQFRKVMNNHHESDIEATARRKKVSVLAPIASFWC